MLRRRHLLRAIPVLPALSIFGAARAKITDVRLVRLKLLKEVGTYPDWVGGHAIFTHWRRHDRPGAHRSGDNWHRSGRRSSAASADQKHADGADPFDVELHAARLSALPTVGLRGPASVEIALWDLIGKLTNQPLYKLWGGGRDKVPPYSSMLRLSTPEERADIAVKIKAEGWQGIKYRCSFEKMKDDVRLVELTRVDDRL